MKMRKILSIFLAAGLLLGMIPIQAHAADWGEGDTLESALSELKVAFDDTKLDWLCLPTLGVIELRYTYFKYKNERKGTVDEHPIYCIDPTKGGAYAIVLYNGANSDGSNTATYIRGSKVGDAKYKAIMAAGYPHKRLTDLGLSNREEGYYATKLALWMYIRGNSPSKLTINPEYGNSHAAAKRVKEAATNIYNQGVNGGAAKKPKMTLTGKPGSTANLDDAGEYYVQGIEVYTSGWVGSDPDNSGDVKLTWDSDPPEGTIVLGSNNEDITSSMKVKMTEKDGWYGKVTIKYPAASIDPNTYSPPTLNAEALIPNDDIYVAYAKLDKTKYQRYLVEADPKVLMTESFVSQLGVDSEEEEYPDSSLRIYKLQTGTNIPLAGAVFEVRDSEGSLLYSMATDETGIIDLPELDEGYYTITEITPPEYHLLPENSTQGVTVRSGVGAEVTFTNDPYGTLRVVKRDAADGEPLEGAAIQIRSITTNATREGITDSSGTVVFDNLPVGAWEIVELVAPEGYALDTTPHTVNVVSLADGETSYTLTNKANPGLRITKFDLQTMRPIEGVAFEVWHDGTLYGTYVTDAWGEIDLFDLPAGTWTAREIATVEPYVLDPTAQWVELSAGQDHISQLHFFNLQKPGIRLLKIDSESYAPLEGARFRITHIGGTFSQEYLTDKDGEINLTGLEPGAYQCLELSAPDGYLIDDAVRTIQINAGETAQFIFANTRKPGLRILKVDAVTGEPLKNAVFRVSKAEGGTVSEYTTNDSGEILIENLDPAIYRVEEIMPPDGYILSDGEKQIQLHPGTISTLMFENTRKPTLIVTKTNGLTGRAVPGTVYKIEWENPDGGVVSLGSYKTDANGQIIIPKVQPGWYIVTETKAAPGFSLPRNPVSRKYLAAGENAYSSVAFSGTDTGGGSDDILVIPDVPIQPMAELPVENYPLNAIVIRKTHAITGELLPGAVFELYRADEQVSGVPGTCIGRYTTDNSGTVIITGLEPGYYVCKEVQPPQNFLLSENCIQNGFLKADGTSVLEFTFANYPYGGLLIAKTDKQTGKPLSGAQFKVTDSSGAVVGSTNGLFTTDGNGEILIPNLKPGAYVVTETQAPSGYILDTTPQTIEVGTDGKIYRVSFTNQPLGGLTIIKLDSVTRQPIAGVEFTVSKLTGELLGKYKTDSSGIISLPGLESGWYSVVETKAAVGYVRDGAPKIVEIKWGKPMVLEVENKPKTGFRLLKIDSETKQPIYNTEFMLFDHNNRLIGTFYTDNNGVIEYDGDLPLEKCTLRETRAAPGYVLDAVPKTIQFTPGKMIEITWENTPELGQIQITKKSADANRFNFLPKGSLLSGAVFEIYDYKTGNLINRITTGSDGRAVSKPLRLGRYTVKEVTAPKYYILSSKTLDITLEYAGQIIKKTVLNTSVDTGVSIKKTGNKQAMPGDTIAFTIQNVKNTSNVQLTDFYWRDTLPTQAVRLEKLVTGTYNQSLKYKVVVTTSKGKTKTVADNLSTAKNNVIDCSAAALGLSKGETVTNITLMFGTVKAGFAQKKKAQVYVTVLKSLSNGYKFANKSDVGGKHGGKWVRGYSTWTTKVYALPGTLPKTGY